MVVVTAQFLQRVLLRGGEGTVAAGSQSLNCRTPEYARMRAALNSVPLDDSEMPLDAHAPEDAGPAPTESDADAHETYVYAEKPPNTSTTASRIS